MPEVSSKSGHKQIKRKSSYQPGTVAGHTNILDLYQRAMAGSEYVEERKEEIELAAAEQEEAFAQRQADYEAACETREAEGQAKLIQGGLAIVIGTIAIVKYIFTYGHQSAKN